MRTCRWIPACKRYGQSTASSGFLDIWIPFLQPGKYAIDSSCSIFFDWIHPEIRWAINLKSYNAEEPQRFSRYFEAVSASSMQVPARAYAEQ